jgi:uncharacterized SAM-binding protein YcdF (DUF218 family)
MNGRSGRTGFVIGLVAALGFAGVLTGLGGFLSFIVLITHTSNLASALPAPGSLEAPRTSDAIVVLTGGDARLEAGMDLLALKRGKRLLISGVNADIDRAQVRNLIAPSVLAHFDCCVDLDKSAANTIGNAIETARWAAEHHYSHILVVTANYHMPRALAEMNRAAPQILWVPHAVAPEDMHLADWWRWPGSARLLFSEYVKYLAMQARFRLETN